MIRDPDTLAALLDSITRFVRERLVPNEAQVADDDAIPPAIVAEMKALGLFGLSIPVEYGGIGLTMEEEVRVAFELGRTSPAFRSLIGTNNGIAGQVIAKFGTDRQKQDFLPGLASGDLVASFALTEAEAGSDPSGLRTSDTLRRIPTVLPFLCR